MIDAECPRCGDQGPHSVIRDREWEADAVCRSCFAYIHIVLYDNKQEVPDRAKD